MTTIDKLNAQRVTRIKTLAEAERIAAKLNHDECADGGRGEFIYAPGASDDGEAFVICVYSRGELFATL